MHYFGRWAPVKAILVEALGLVLDQLSGNHLKYYPFKAFPSHSSQAFNGDNIDDFSSQCCLSEAIDDFASSLQVQPHPAASKLTPLAAVDGCGMQLSADASSAAGHFFMPDSQHNESMSSVNGYHHYMPKSRLLGSDNSEEIQVECVLLRSCSCNPIPYALKTSTFCPR